MHPITAVILAAGRSERMGQTKPLLPWGDTTMLGHILAVAGQTAVRDQLVVTGHDAAAVAAVAAAHGATVVHNPDYAAGEMLSSLQTAVRHLLAGQSPPTAILVLLADQPLIAPATIDRICRAFDPEQAPLVAPLYDGRRGHPVLFGRRHFDELLALPPGAQPRDLLARHAAELVLLPVDSPAVQIDLDHPADYERWRPRE